MGRLSMFMILEENGAGDEIRTHDPHRFSRRL